MKFKNSTFSFIRHTLTLVGGVLFASPDPVQKAIGVILGAIGTGWGVKDEHTAENPGLTLPKPPPGAVHMLILGLAGFVVASSFTGCASGPGANATPAQLEARAYALVNTAGVVIAHDNPELAVEIQRIAAGVDAVFEKGVLTPEQLKAFLGALNVPEDKRLLVAVGVNNAYELYKAETGQELIDVTNPTAAASCEA